MSIKSKRNNLDLLSMTMANQREPNYIMNNPDVKIREKKYGQVDDMSDYVEKNIADNVKKRYGEYR